MASKNKPTTEAKVDKKTSALLEFGDPFGEKISISTRDVYSEDNPVFDFLSQNKYKKAQEILDRLLPGGKTEGEYDISEEAITDEDNTVRIYRTWRNRITGNVVAKSLIDNVEGVSLEKIAGGEGDNPYTNLFAKQRLFKVIQSHIDPESGEIRRDIGKSFWDNAFDNSLTFQLGRLTSDILGGDKTVGKHGGGLFSNKEEMAFLNNVELKNDGVYYRGRKIITDPEEIALVGEFLGEKFSYKPDNFVELFANTAATFAVDMPLFMVAGGIAGKAVKTILPGISTASNIPSSMLNHLIRTNATLSIAETPSIIKHTQEGGINAFVEDLKHIGEFSVFASAFGIAGDFVGGGISKLLGRGRNLSNVEAVKFLRKNPQVTKQLSTGFTSGMLGYATSDGSFEDKLATGLTFAAMHFSNVEAWKGYLGGENKKVMVEMDTFNELKTAVKGGKSLLKAIKETQTRTPRYFIEEEGKLYEIHSDKFTKTGEIERPESETPITLTKENSTNFRYITETAPFAKKTLGQAWKEQELVELKDKLYKKMEKESPNPFNKETQKNEYLTYEYNRSLTASHLADMLYSQKLATAFRRNQLPEDIKLNQFIAKTSEYFNIPVSHFERHIASSFVDYVKDPKAFKESEAFKFLPEEYQKQFEKGLMTLENAFVMEMENALTRETLRDIANETAYGNIPDLAKNIAKAVKRPPITKFKSAVIPEPETKRRNIGLRKAKKVSEVNIEEIKTVSDLNEALERVEQPLELFDKIRGKSEQKAKEEKAPKTTTPEIREGEKEISITIPEGYIRAEKGKGELRITDVNVKESERGKGKGKQLYKSLIEEAKKRNLDIVSDTGVQPQAANIYFALEKEGIPVKRSKNIKEFETKKGKVIGVEGGEVGERPFRIPVKEMNDAPFKKTVEEAGGVFKGVQRKNGEPTHVLVESPREGTTRYIPIKEFSKERVVEEIKKIDKDFTEAREPKREKIAKEAEELNKTLETWQEALRKKGMTEEEVLNETYDNPRSTGYRIVERLQELNAEKHAIERQSIFPEGEKAIKLSTGEIISSPDIKSHLDFAKTLPKETIDKIVDTGIKLPSGEFKSTATVPMDAFREALSRIAGFKSIMGEPNFNPFANTQMVKDLATIGTHIFEKGFQTLKAWSGEMIKTLGQGIKKFLSRIWNITSQYLSGKRAILDPNILVSIGGGKSRNNQKQQSRMSKDEEQKWKEQVPSDLQKYTNESLYKNRAEYENALAILARYYKPEENEKMGKVAPELPSRPYRPGNLLDSGKVLWHPDATTHADVIIKLQDEGKLSKDFDFDSIESSGSIAPSGYYYDQKFRGDVTAEDIASQRQRLPIDEVVNSKNNQKQPDLGNIDNLTKFIEQVGTPKKEAKNIVSGSSVRDSKRGASQTQRELKQIDALIKRLDRYKPKKKSGRLVGTTLTPDEYNQLRDIRKVANMTAEEVNATVEKLNNAFRDLERERNKSGETDELLESEARLEEMMYNALTFGDIANKRGERLKQAIEEVNEVIATGRTKRDMLETARKERRDNLRKMAKESIGFEALDEQEARRQGLSKEKSTWLDKLYEFDTEMLGFEHVLKKISHKNDNFANHVIRQTKLAGNKEDAGNIMWQKVLEDKLHEIYKVESKHKLSKIIAKNKERVEKSGVFDAEGKELILSQNEAYKKWMEWQDPTLRETMQNMGYTPETIKQLEKFMTPEIKQWAEWQIKEFYPEYYRGINEVFRRMTYTDLPFNEFYSPIERETSAQKHEDLLNRPTSPYATVFNNHLLSRVNSKIALKYLDGDAAISSHIAQMERFKAWAETVKELRGIFGDNDLRTIIKQRSSPATVGVINRFIDDIARGSIDRGKVYPTIDKIRNNFTRAVLGINPTLIPKQLSSFPAYATTIPIKDFISGMGEALANPKKALEILSEADFMTPRYKQGFDRDIRDALAKGTSKKLAGASSISDALLLNVKLGDKAAVILGGYPVYKYHLNRFIAEGRTKEQAHKDALLEFQLATERMQQSGKIEDLADLQRAGSLGKLFTMFMSQPNQYYRVASGAFRDMVRGKGDFKQNLKTFGVAHFLLPMLFQFIADGFSVVPSRQLRAGVLGSFNGFFVIGQILEAGFSGLQGDWHFAVESTPVIDAPKQLVEAMDKFGKLMDDGEIKTEEVLTIADRIARGVSKLQGIPYEPVKRTTQGVIESVEEGEFSLKTLGFGDVALRQTRDDMKEAKRQTAILKKQYQRNPTEDNRVAYLEAKREFERLKKELKKKSQKEK